MSPDALVRKSRLAALLTRQLLSPVSDKTYLSIRYLLRFGRWPDYAARNDFNECIHEYMLRCRDPLLKVVADKHSVRDYISATLGDEYLVPCLGVWNDAARIPIESLPFPFVLKATIGSGMNLFVRNREDCDVESLRATAADWLSQDFSRWNREWCYEGTERRVIAERMLVTGDGTVPSDIKFYVVGNKVRFIQVDRNRFSNHTRNLYSSDWKLMPVRLTKANHAPDPAPQRLADMVAAAEKLAAPFEFLRVDFYDVDGAVMVGELTNYSGAGFETFIPSSYGLQLADWWKAAQSSQAQTQSQHEKVSAGPPSASQSHLPAEAS